MNEEKTYIPVSIPVSIPNNDTAGLDFELADLNLEEPSFNPESPEINLTNAIESLFDKPVTPSPPGGGQLDQPQLSTPPGSFDSHSTVSGKAKAKTPQRGLQAVDFSDIDMSKIDEVALSVTSTTFANLSYLNANFQQLCERNGKNSNNKSFHNTAHSSPVQPEGDTLLNLDIESHDLSKTSDINELRDYRDKLRIALETQRRRNLEEERMASEYRTHMIDIAKYLKIERDSLQKTVNLAPFKNKQLQDQLRELTDSKFNHAEKDLSDFMNKLALRSPELHIRRSENLAEAWDNAAGLIEVMQEDVDLLKKLQEQDLQSLNEAESSIAQLEEQKKLLGECTNF